MKISDRTLGNITAAMGIVNLIVGVADESAMNIAVGLLAVPFGIGMILYSMR